MNRTSKALLFTVITISISFAAEQVKEKPSDLASETSVKRYVGRAGFKPFDTIKAFKFIAFRGDFSSWDPNEGKEIKSKPANEFQTEQDSMVFIRDTITDETAGGVVVGNAGTASCIVMTGKNDLSFFEMKPAGYAHQFTVTRTWNPKLGGFNCTYHRRACLDFNGKSAVLNTIYYGAAVPWE